MIANRRCSLYREGRFEPSELPLWYPVELVPDDDTALAKAGCSLYARYGDGADLVSIYKVSDGTWLVEFYDVSHHILTVRIESPADYIQFHAAIVAPHVALIEAAEPAGLIAPKSLLRRGGSNQILN